jgi:DNA polymerase-4
VDSFLLPLPVSRLPGVGKVTEKRLNEFGVKTVKDLRELDQPTLETLFGRYSLRLYDLARGIDNNQVIPNRPTKPISAEDTFEHDVLLADTESVIRLLAEKVWMASRKESRIPRTVVLKLKTADFTILTRSHTPESAPACCEDLTAIALGLRDRVDLGPQRRFRLVGVGLSNFRDPEDPPLQSGLFG